MNKILKTLMTILIVVSVITQGITIFISNTSATDSIRASELEIRLVKLNEDNINIESEILTHASYQAVASRAAELGFGQTREFVSVYDPVRLALSR